MFGDNAVDDTVLPIGLLIRLHRVVKFFGV